MGHIQDIQDSSSSWLSGRILARVMRYVVTVNDVVVPVALSWLEGGALESKGTFPGARLGGCFIF